MGPLQAKTALVTGGSRGIGRAIAERLASDGAAVALTYRERADAAAAVVGGIEARGGRALALPLDLGSVADVRRCAAEADAALGGLDLVVLNAATGRLVTIADTTEDDVEAVWGPNLRGSFFVLQEAARRVRDGGRIVVLSSLNTVIPPPGRALYASSKAALELLAAVAAKELGGRGITVNSVSPGATDTELLRGSNPPELLPVMAAMSPLGRLGQPEDVAAVVAFLCGPDGGWVTGQNLRAGGGIA